MYDTVAYVWCTTVEVLDQNPSSVRTYVVKPHLQFAGFSEVLSMKQDLETGTASLQNWI